MKFVADLPDKQRRSVELRLFRDMSFAEVAAEIGGSEDSAKMNFHHAMKRLRGLLEGEAEQWVGKEKRIMRPGEVVHVPRDEVHGTYNSSNKPIKFLAVLSEAKFDGPAVIDMSQDEPWKSMRRALR